MDAAAEVRIAQVGVGLGVLKHFIRDFRLVVGRSPAEYAAEAALARDDQISASGCESASRAA